MGRGRGWCRGYCCALPALFAAGSLLALGAGPAGAAALASGSCAGAAPTKVGSIAGIVAARPPAGGGSAACPGPAPAVSQAASPAQSYSGDPPLVFHSGPLMGTTSTVTVTPIYWAPSGFGYPGTYQTLTEQFIADVAADSGSTTERVLGPRAVHRRGQQPIPRSDHVQRRRSTTPTPTRRSGGCTPDTGAVYSDGPAIRPASPTRRSRQSSPRSWPRNGLPSDLNHLYSCSSQGRRVVRDDRERGSARRSARSRLSSGGALLRLPQRLRDGWPTIYADSPTRSRTPRAGSRAAPTQARSAGGRRRQPVPERQPRRRHRDQL